MRYRQLLGAARLAVEAVVAVERKPSDAGWVALCNQLGVALVWPGQVRSLI